MYSVTETTALSGEHISALSHQSKKTHIRTSQRVACGSNNDNPRYKSWFDCMLMWVLVMKQRLWLNKSADKWGVKLLSALSACLWMRDAPLKGSFSWTMLIKPCWLFPLSLIYTARTRVFQAQLQPLSERFDPLLNNDENPQRAAEPPGARVSSPPRETDKRALCHWVIITDQKLWRRTHLLC